MRCLVWFREDLRVNDNAALYHASKAANNGLIAVYIISAQVWRMHDIAACRVDFILRHLQILSDELRALNIPLLIIHADHIKQVPELLLQLMQAHHVDALYFNEQYEIDEMRRDGAVENLLKLHRVKVFSYTDQLMVAPGELLTMAGNYYTVFTPFKKAWLKAMVANKVMLFPAPTKQIQLPIKGDGIPAKIAEFNNSIPIALWPVGEKQAQDRLKKFTQTKIKYYAKQRDFPAIDGTSVLSPYLAAGILSPRQCLKAAMEVNNQCLDKGDEGIICWINELIWREFYKYVLYAFPRVSMHRAFKIATENIHWDNDPTLFAAWCEGRTGYPIIDAAMRQLCQIGWMHNRLRMLTAMFLVKDLLIDWRWGEKFFMQHLIDGDLAANNGGWQWAASTGTDAVPYFRIFNPTAQSKKFDPNGNFIRHYCPELAHLSHQLIHEPFECATKDIFSFAYPAAVVNHAKSRQRFLEVFKQG